jgi:hypothetical protein
MAAYQTQQINVGSIAAPDVGSVFTSFADRINKQQSNQLDNMRQAAQYDRQQVLNQRADQEWNRQQGARKNIADITKEYMNAPYAAKFAGDQEVAALDKRVQSMPQSVWENLTPEQATALQEKYENIGQNKEVARTKLMGALMADGNVDYTAANALADDLTKGLMSRADKQAALEAQYKAQLDANKVYNDYIGNVNKDTVDIYKAKLDYQKTFGPNGTGGGTAGSTGPALKEFNAGTTMDDVYKYIEYKSLGGLDSSGGRDKVRALYNDGKGLHPAVILQALQNNTVTGGGLLSDNYINQEGLDQSLVGKKLGQEGLNELIMQLRNRQPMNLADPTRAEYVDPRSITRQVYNSAPDANKFLSEALKDDRLAFLRTPDEQDKATKAISQTTAGSGSNITTKMPESLQKSEGVSLTPYKDTKGNITVGVGYNMSGKSDEELQRDFKEAGIDTKKITGLKSMDGTALTPSEVSRLTDVSYDRYGVQKAKSIGLDLTKMDPTLAEIAVSQVYRGDIVKDGNGYRGRLYEILKNNDTKGMIDYVKTDKSLPKEVRTRLDNVLDRVSPLTEEQYIYNNSKASVKDMFNKVSPVATTVNDQALQSAKADYRETGGGLLDDIRIKANLSRDGGVSPQEADMIYNQVKDSIQSDNNIAYRNYLIAKRTGSYQGKSADDWYKELDSKSKAATYAPAAPLIAAGVPAYELAAGLLPMFAGGVESAPILGRVMSNNASEKAAELMNVLKSPKMTAGEIQQTKDALTGLAKQYPELRTEIIKFLQNL